MKSWTSLDVHACMHPRFLHVDTVMAAIRGEGIIVDRSDDASMKRFNVVPFNVTRPAKIHFPREISIVSISSTRYNYLYDRNSIFFSFLSLFLYYRLTGY